MTRKKNLKFSEKVIIGITAFSMSFFIAGVVYAFLNRSDSFWSYAFPTVGIFITSAFGIFEVKEFSLNKIKTQANPMYDLQKELFTDDELRDIFKSSSAEDLKGE